MTSKQQTLLISAIADRAVKMYARFGMHMNKFDIVLDIDCVHASTPLRLKEWLEADDFNFSHDIAGIYKHLNRETKQLEGCFMPRFAAR